MAKLVFFGAAVLLVHTYFLYPAILFALDGLRQLRRNVQFMRSGKDRRQARAPEAWPSVTLVIAAHNEESCIGDKLANSLAIEYPADKFEVLIGSDGSTDRTDEIIRACADKRVRLSAAPRQGKTGVLNRCIPEAKGEIVVLSDANTVIDPQAVRRLVEHFRDPEVGAVCGKLRLFNRSKQDYEESLYWFYESVIKFYEGKQGVVMGANGGLYAIRRSLFTVLPPTTIVDDFVIPLRLMERGHKVTYEPTAVAQEETTEDYEREFKRRARIAAGNFQSLKLVPGLLTPFAGLRAFAFWSHKLLRWMAPGLMALALLANLALIQSSLFRVVLAAQLAFYGLAWAGRQRVGSGTVRKAASICYYFVTMNLAIAVGFWRFLRHSQPAAWDRTARV